MKTSIRMPRPEGVTILCQEVYRAKSKETKRERRQRLLNHLVNIYAMSGFRLNGRSLTIAQFSNVIGAQEEVVQSALFNKASTMRAFSDPEQLKDTANALAGMCTSWAIQDRGLVMAQVEAMMKAQKGKYKPFISAEVRQTLSTLLQSNKQVADIFRTFYQGSGFNINITNQNTQQANVLTVEKAYEIAKASLPEVQRPQDPRKAQILPESSLKALEDTYHLSESEHTIRQFEHLDNSGWERKAQVQIASSPTQQENIDSELQYKVASKLLKREYAQGQDAPTPDSVSDSEYVLAEEVDPDAIQVIDNGLDPDGYQDLASGEVNAASGYVRATDKDKATDEAPDGFQYGVQDGDIRDTTSGFRNGDFGGGLIAPGPESPNGRGTQQRKGLRAPGAPEPNGPTGTQVGTETLPVQAPKKLPKKVAKKPNKAQTLSGLKLGSKAPEALEPVNVKALKKAREAQGSKAPAVSYKHDKMDRHLNPDRRRNIATIDNGELPGRGYQD